MGLSEKLNHPLRALPLTRRRITFTLAFAVAADILQFFLGPLGWTFGDQIIDVAVMLITVWLIGFHWLLLPSFVLEFIPLTDELPTWTACVIAVIVLRKREQRMPPLESPEKQRLKSD